MRNNLGLKIVKIFLLDRKFLQFSKQQIIARELNTLYGGTENEKRLYRKYLAGKIEYLVWGIVVIAFLLFGILLTPGENKELNGNVLVRNGYEGNEKNIYLKAKSEGMEEEIEVWVEPLHYSKEQLDNMARKVFENIPREYFNCDKITGEGIYVIKNDILLPEQIEGYPFELSWESSNYEVMDREGTITIQNAKSPEEVTVTVVLKCYDYSWEYEYTFLVYKAETVWEENFSNIVTEVIEELDNLSADKKELVLPTEIEGHFITYEEKKDNSFIFVLGLGVVVIILLWFLPDNKLSKQMEERNNQLLVDYVKFVSKLTLYMGAGLSFRSTVAKIVENADKSRFYAKELEIVMRELENGISEQRAIEGLAERCKIPCYIKLAVLMNQNIRKGNNSLQKQLKGEMDKAFEERKNFARKCGEEAGTKLLFPMILMLLVVIVMIMYPAFVSFTI